MYDHEIRTALIQFLLNKSKKPKGIIEELPVHNGNAIADLVALYNEPHCFEIKGSNDKIARALKQGNYYNTSFNKVTLVTTSKQARAAINTLPKWWGIIAVDRENDRISFRYIRGAKTNKLQDKPLSLQLLWRSEMLDVAESNEIILKPKNANRSEVANSISKHLTKDKINQILSATLLERSKTKFKNKSDMAIDHRF